MITQGTGMNVGEPKRKFTGKTVDTGIAKPINGEDVQLTLWQSDQLIVVMKPGNAGGAKGLTVSPETSRATSAGHRVRAQMGTKLKSLTQRAQEKTHLKFTSLAYLLDKEFLLGCFMELKKDKAPGIDSVGVEEYEIGLEKKIENLVERLKRKQYRPLPVRRVYIPKDEKNMRPLGIPAVEDKIVQMGITKILEAIFEPEFVDTSYGFRPKRSCHQAIDRLASEIIYQPISYLVDMDIRGYFDNVDHKWMMKALEQKVADKGLLQIIGRILKAGVIEAGKFMETDRGTPQGGILSPVLSNIYLHYILDKWFEVGIKAKASGYCQLVRYADDFVAVFQYRDEAKAFADKLRQRLGKYGLEIAEEKSKVIAFGRFAEATAKKKGKKPETFDFLGFTHYLGKSNNGKFIVKVKTSQKRLRKKLKEMNQWLRSHRTVHEFKTEYWNTLAKKLSGHYQYYGRIGNIRMVKAYYHKTIRLAFKWLNRRSQRQSHNWEQFWKFLKYNPLPQPRITQQIQRVRE